MIEIYVADTRTHSHLAVDAAGEGETTTTHHSTIVTWVNISYDRHYRCLKKIVFFFAFLLLK